MKEDATRKPDEEGIILRGFKNKKWGHHRPHR
jgi:hypothetical protein